MMFTFPKLQDKEQSYKMLFTGDSLSDGWFSSCLRGWWWTGAGWGLVPDVQSWTCPRLGHRLDTAPTLLLLPRSLGTPVAVSAPQITLHSLTLLTTITGILSPDSQVRVTPVTGYARSLSPQLTVICSVVSGVRAGRAVTACAAQSARPVLEISDHVTMADPRLPPPSVLFFTTPS